MPVRYPHSAPLPLALLLVALCLTISDESQAAPCNFGPSGGPSAIHDFEGADVVVENNIHLCSGRYLNIRNLLVPSDRTLNLGDGAKVEIRADSIRVLGTIDGRGRGDSGGSGCNRTNGGSGDTGHGDGAGEGGGSASSGSHGGGGGGGAGHVGDGGDGGRGHSASPGGQGGDSYPPLQAERSLPSGSGGGGGACGRLRPNADVGGSGGNGGGVLVLVGSDVRVDGNVRMNGASGANGSNAGGGGGGGSGGSLSVVARERLIINGNLDVRGGNGGNGSTPRLGSRAGGGGGGGSGGRLNVDSPGGCSSELGGTLRWQGGAGGSGAGSADDGSEGAEGHFLCRDSLIPLKITSFTASPQPGFEGQVVSLNAQVLNPNQHRIDYTFDCGNGKPPIETTENSVDCVYDDNLPDNVSYQATVVARGSNRVPFTNANGDVTHQAGSVALTGPVEAHLAVEVENLPPEVVFIAPDNPMPGEELLIGIEVSDSSPLDQEAGFSVSWRIGEPPVVQSSAHNLFMLNHTFNQSGSYPVQILVIDKDGGLSQIDNEIVIPNLPPVVNLDLSPLQPIQGKIVNFEASAHDWSPEDAAAGYHFLFDFGDGNTHSLSGGAYGDSVFVSHVYETAGEFTVQVWATDASHQTSEAVSREVVVQPGSLPPSAAIIVDPAPIDEGDSTVITASFSAQEPGATVSNCTVYFGDGSSKSFANPQTPLTLEHRYEDSGTFTAWILVKDSAGAQNTARAEFEVRNLPPVVFLEPGGTGWEGLPLRLSAIASDPSPLDEAAGLTYIWDFGDGSPTRSGVELKQPSHIWENSGSYQVTVVVRDKDGGESDPVSTEVTIENVPPTLQLNYPAAGDEGEVLQFGAEATDPSPHDTDAGFYFVWDFGDGSEVQEGQDLDSVEHVYEQDGNYELSVSVSDISGGTTVERRMIQIHNVAPTVEFGPPLKLARHEEVQLQATVFDPGIHDELSYHWDFGDGSSSTEESPLHSWSISGEIEVVLTVTDDAGDSGSGSLTVVISNERPEISDLRLLPLTPLPADDLKAEWNYFDADGDPEQESRIRWFVNGILRSRLTGMAQIPASRTLQGELWRVEVTPNDGYEFGDSVLSNSVTIGNHPPGVYNLRIVPSEPRRGDSLSLRYDFVDPDGDAEQESQIRWLRNGEEMREFDDLLVISPELTRGDFWAARIRPFDGTDFGGEQESDAVTVKNSPPVIVPLPPIVVPVSGPTTPVSWTVEASDPDGDALSYRCVHESTVFGTTENIQVDLHEGIYEVQCSVRDGIDESTTLVQVLVGNRGLLLSAGEDRKADPGRIRLNAVARDSQDRPIVYEWRVLDAPAEVVFSTSHEAEADFFAVTPGIYDLEVSATNGVDTAVDSIRIEIRDLPPHADPGKGPLTVNAGEPLKLDGSGSKDPNGSDLSFSWKRVRGPAVEFLSSQEDVTVEFIAHDPGELVLRLEVSDGVYNASAEISIRVLASETEATPPEARAGNDVVALLGETVILDGSASFDLDGDPLIYRWEQASGPFIQLIDAEQSVASFVASQAGTLEFWLKVSDGLYESTDTVFVEVLDSGSNRRPVARITGSSLEVKIGDAVFLDGSSSSDPDGDPLSFHWEVVDGPWLNIESPKAMGSYVVPVNEGTSRVALLVNDGMVDSFPDHIEIVASEIGPVQPPVARAVGPELPYVGEVLELDASESFDPAGFELSYSWSVLEGDTELIDADSPKATFIPRRSGSHIFKLVVSNPHRESEAVTLEVKVEGLPELLGGCNCASGSFQSVWALLLIVGWLMARRREVMEATRDRQRI